MSTQITIEGRLVQGGVTLKPKKDMKTNKPILDPQSGQPINECFLAVAFPKFINGQPNPKASEYWAALVAQARASFPHLFDAAGNCSNPKFAFKWQDGDGVDDNGQSVADKPGFAGHYIIKMATRYAPTCYARDSHGNLVQIPNPEQVIKRGYNIAVGVTIDGNGVEPGNRQAVPGLFVSPNLILFVSPGEEIISGPDPNAVFGNVASQTGLAQGVAVGGSAPPNLAPPQMQAPMAGPPQAGPAPLPGGAPTMGPPAPPAGPQYVMQPSAQGASREALLGMGWTDEGLIQAGHMIRVG